MQIENKKSLVSQVFSVKGTYVVAFICIAVALSFQGAILLLAAADVGALPEKFPGLEVDGRYLKDGGVRDDAEERLYDMLDRCLLQGRNSFIRVGCVLLALSAIQFVLVVRLIRTGALPVPQDEEAGQTFDT